MESQGKSNARHERGRFHRGLLIVRQGVGDISERFPHAGGELPSEQVLKQYGEPGYSVPISTYLTSFESTCDTRVCFTFAWGTSRPEREFQICVREYVPPACRKIRPG
jgi:hypothetical protein